MFASLVALYLLIFYTNFVWLVARPLQVNAPLSSADAIVVFAGGVGESGKAGGGTEERVQYAVDVFKRGLANRMVLSSGYVYSFPEAQVMRSLAMQQGVPDEAIIVEERSTDTHQNVEYVNGILKSRGWRSALLVSSPYHMRRALMVWHKSAPDVGNRSGGATPQPVLRSRPRRVV